jgi:FtsZ-interacting cell division protein ZipA
VWGWVIIAVVAVVVIIAVAYAAWSSQRRRRSEALQQRFGPEYDRVASTVKNRDQAEGLLEQRQKRVEKFDIRTLSEQDRARFAGAWRDVQAKFVDAPADAVRDADRLVSEVMSKRGYPIGTFEQQAADISVDHPQVVSNYRAAHGLALKDERGEASTEDLRQAMVHYRALFEDLLGAEAPARRTA